MKRSLYLLLVIFLEGYAVLSSELLAIRQLTPYVGNGTDTISIIIAAVLLPLAFGYFAGGQFVLISGRRLRDKLLRNMFIALVILSIISSHVVIQIFFETLIVFGSTNPLVNASLYSALLIIPVYLLGQTIPLISNYLPKDNIAQTTGIVLFASTLGSLLGAVFATIVLMSTVGVHNTATLTIATLFFAIFILSKRKTSWTVAYSLAILFVMSVFNSDLVMKRYNIVSNDQYHTARILRSQSATDPLETRVLMLNNNLSSMYSDNPANRAPYAQFIEDNFINHRMQGDPIDILVIGAGGFVLGSMDGHNNYIFLDINPNLQEISEEYLLKQKLRPNKEFIATPARAYLTQTDKNFDLIILDAFTGGQNIPEHLLTQEFFMQIKNTLNPDGIMVMNAATSGNFDSAQSVNIDTTMRTVFPNMIRQIIQPFNGWWNNPELLQNVMYVYFNKTSEFEAEIYTDNLNRSVFDRRKSVRE